MGAHLSDSLPARSPKQYLARRRSYEPDEIKLVVEAESPPGTWLYFYDPIGRTTEQLFAAIMRQLDYAPKTKDQGLHEISAGVGCWSMRRTSRLMHYVVRSAMP